MYSCKYGFIIVGLLDFAMWMQLMMFLMQVVAAVVFAESPEEIGDLYLDIAEAYMEEGEYSDAQPILASLVESEKYNLVGCMI